MKRIILILPLLLSACSHGQKNDSTVTVCHGDVCSLQDKNATSVATNAVSEPIQSAEEAYQQALRYFSGDGVTQDSYQAIKALTRAAEKGHRPAQKTLGKIYLFGMEEMGSDPAQAEHWLSAASSGDPEIEKLLTIARREKRDQQAEYEWQERRRQFYHLLFNTYRHRPVVVIKHY